VNVEDPPLVFCHSEQSAQTARLLDSLGEFLRKRGSGPFHCTIHEDNAERAQDDRCGSWMAPLGREPFPEGVEHDGLRYSWPIRRDKDGLWRPMAGSMCGFTLSDEAVERLCEERGLTVGRDSRTREIVLCEPSGRAPLIPLKDWEGECNFCGLCCMSPRPATGLPCRQLEPGLPTEEP
jgi:hypothetical protein